MLAEEDVDAAADVVGGARVGDAARPLAGRVLDGALDHPCAQHQVRPHGPGRKSERQAPHERPDAGRVEDRPFAVEVRGVAVLELEAEQAAGEETEAGAEVQLRGVRDALVERHARVAAEVPADEQRELGLGRRGDGKEQQDPAADESACERSHGGLLCVRRCLSIIGQTAGLPARATNPCQREPLVRRGARRQAATR